MVTGIHGPLKIIAFNVMGSWRQRYELRKQLEDVTVFSETPLKPHEVLYTFIESTPTQEEKAELPLQLEKACPSEWWICLLTFQ
jgi:hypothetical protein